MGEEYAMTIIQSIPMEVTEYNGFLSDPSHPHPIVGSNFEDIA